MQIGRDDAAFDIQMHLVKLLDDKTRTFFCFDVYLEGCDASLRAEMESSTRQPIHLIIQRKHICYARRHQRADALVATEFGRVNDDDKGPKPFFVNLEVSGGTDVNM